MKIGIPKEIMTQEHRIGLMPHHLSKINNSKKQHEFYVEKGLGKTIGLTDSDWIKVGAKILPTAKEVWTKSNLIIKCKEPIESEYKFLREDLILYSFLDLAYSKTLAKALTDSKVTSICGETIAGPNNDYPVLIPQSIIAGRLAAQIASNLLTTNFGGIGRIILDIKGCEKTKAVVIGGGVVGKNAAKVLAAFGAEVTVLDINKNVAKDEIFKAKNIKFVPSTKDNIKKALKNAHIAIGAVLLTGTPCPKLVSKSDIKLMSNGGVIVDVSADLGGCFETIHQTNHDNPTYKVDGIIHYAVANIPGIVAQTSSEYYSKESLPYVKTLIEKGLIAMLKMPGAEGGLNAYKGKIALKTAAQAFKMPYIDVSDVINKKL